MAPIMDGQKTRLSPKGYPSYRKTVNGKMKTFYVHLVVWENVNGKKPDGFDIHHIDHNKTNYSLDNLQLISKSDHKKLHANWIQTDGQWTHKPCTICKEINNLSFFNKNHNGKCTSCHSLYRKRMKHRWQQ